MNFYVSKEKLILWGVLSLIAIITGIIVGCNVHDGGVGLYTTFAIVALGAYPYVKKLILYVGRHAVDFATTLDLILGASILFAGIYCANEYLSYWWFVLATLLYVVATALKNYVLYLLIDVRDSLHKLAYGENTEKQASKAPVSIPNDMKQCSKCGQMIKQTAKKCRYCGEWLNEEVKGEE